jgi:hypothetical protein
MVVCRRAFFTFCNQLYDDEEDQDILAYVQFLDWEFRLRICDDDEVYRHFVQRILQKCLAKSLVSKLEIAKRFRQITSEKKIASVVDFLHNATPLDIVVFDDLLFLTLKQLVPTYRQFLVHAPAGQIIRDSVESVISTSLNVAATMMQCLFRRRHAKIVVVALRTRNAERLKAQQRGDDDNDDEVDD